MGCLQQDLRFFHLPTEAKPWTLAAKKPAECFRRIEEASEQYMKGWFVTEREKAGKRRVLRFKLRSNANLP